MHIFIICIFYSEVLKTRVKYFWRRCVHVSACVCVTFLLLRRRKIILFEKRSKSKFFPILICISGVTVFEWVNSPFYAACIFTVIHGFQTAFFLHTTSAALHLCRSKFPFYRNLVVGSQVWSETWWGELQRLGGSMLSSIYDSNISFLNSMILKPTTLRSTALRGVWGHHMRWWKCLSGCSCLNLVARAPPLG